MGQQLRKIAKRKRLQLRAKRKKEAIKVAKATPKGAKADKVKKKAAPAAKKAPAKKAAPAVVAAAVAAPAEE